MDKENETLDRLVEENISHEKNIKELTEKLSVAIEALTYYENEHDYGIIAKEALEQIIN